MNALWHLAYRLLIEVDGDTTARARHGLRLCFARPPTKDEVNLMVELYQLNFQIYNEDSGAAKQAVGENWDSLPHTYIALADVAAWTVVANVMLNLDETITRY